jgi:hypothetical protein
LRLVGIDEGYMPAHATGPRGQCADTETHNLTVDIGAGVDARSGSVADFGSAEFGLDLLGEIERNLAWR